LQNDVHIALQFSLKIVRFVLCSARLFRGTLVHNKASVLSKTTLCGNAARLSVDRRWTIGENAFL